MTKKYDHIYRLQEALHDMEKELGLHTLGDHERRVFLAAVGAANSESECLTRDILAHRLLTGISRPSVFRALNKLVDRGLLISSLGKKGRYRIAMP